MLGKCMRCGTATSRNVIVGNVCDQCARLKVQIAEYSTFFALKSGQETVISGIRSKRLAITLQHVINTDIFAQIESMREALKCRGCAAKGKKMGICKGCVGYDQWYADERSKA